MAWHHRVHHLIAHHARHAMGGFANRHPITTAILAASGVAGLITVAVGKAATPAATTANNTTPTSTLSELETWVKTGATTLETDIEGL